MRRQTSHVILVHSVFGSARVSRNFFNDSNRPFHVILLASPVKTKYRPETPRTTVSRR